MHNTPVVNYLITGDYIAGSAESDEVKIHAHGKKLFK